MYTVYAGDHIIYHPQLVDNGYAIYNPVITLEENKSGSFQFTMPVTNMMYNNLQKMSTIITVRKDNEEIFRGRILNDERDFNNNKVIYCEGELSFLLDSIIRPYDFKGTVKEFFTYLIAQHNTQVESAKQFTVGTVSVLPDTQITVSISDYVSTWYTFNTYLLDVYGGYIRVRLDGSVRYIEYVSSYGNTNTQTVAFGTNMLDITQYISAEDVITNLIPLGSTYAVELEDSEITPGVISKTYTEPIQNKNGDKTLFIFSLEVTLNSKSKANGTSNITIKYGVKTKDGSSVSWSNLDGSKIYADIQLDTGIEGATRVNQKTAKPSGTINGTEQVLVTWTGNVKTQNIVITGEFINNYTKSTSAVLQLPISNSMAAVSQLLQQKYLKTTIATVNNNKDYLVSTEGENLFGKIVAIHNWDDVSDPAELKRLGEQYLADNMSMSMKLEVNAVDLNLLNVNYEKFKIGDRVRVVSAPHVLDDYFTCSRITLNLQNPESNTYNFGAERKTLTETQITAAKDIRVTNEMIASINNSLDAVETVTQQLNDLIDTIYDKYADVTTVINNLDAAYADIDFANINSAAIANLVANQALITALDAAYANIDLANITDATIETLMAKDATVNTLSNNLALIDFANITDAAIDNLTSKQALIDNLKTHFIQTDGANIGTAVVNKLKVEGLADVNFANITQAAINQLMVGTASVEGLNAHYADIDFANITNTAIYNALVNTGLFSSLNVEDDVIIGGTLNANSIAAGSITADRLVVRGSDGIYYQLNLGKKNDGSISQTDWDSLTAEQLQTSFHGENIIANTITAKQIQAGSITAEKLGVLDSSQVVFDNGETQETMSTFIADITGLHSTVDTLQSDVSEQSTQIHQNADQIRLRASAETVERNYNDLNDKYDTMSSTVNANSSAITAMSEQISLKVSSSELEKVVDNKTGALTDRITKLEKSALTVNSDAITGLVTTVNNLTKEAEGTAVKVKSDGTYIYHGVANDSGEVDLDKDNYVKIDTMGQHNIKNNDEVSWNTTDGLGAPKLSLGSKSTDNERWTFSMDGDLLNIRWIDNTDNT